MICQQDQISDLPFDLKQHGVAAYTPSLDQRPFTEELKRHLSALNDETHDSPTSDFLNSGLFYCINRSLAHRRFVMQSLRRSEATDSEETLLQKVDQINEEWRANEVQATIVRDDKILRHRDDVLVGTPAKECWQDMVLANESLYAQMNSQGKGLRLAAIKGCLGRLTAIAFESLPERNWLIVVEAHVKQGGL